MSVLPDGAGWRIPAAEAVARIDVDIQSLFDGTVSAIAEDVPFIVTGSIAVLPDGTASITVSGPDPLTPRRCRPPDSRRAPPLAVDPP